MAGGELSLSEVLPDMGLAGFVSDANTPVAPIIKFLPRRSVAAKKYRCRECCRLQANVGLFEPSRTLQSFEEITELPLPQLDKSTKDRLLNAPEAPLNQLSRPTRNPSMDSSKGPRGLLAATETFGPGWLRPLVNLHTHFHRESWWN